MKLPDNLDADQARIVTLTLAAWSKVEKIRAGLISDPEGVEEEASLNCITEQMDELEDEGFALLIRALVEASPEGGEA